MKDERWMFFFLGVIMSLLVAHLYLGVGCQ
jgi:hypothetical protein